MEIILKTEYLNIKLNKIIFKADQEKRFSFFRSIQIKHSPTHTQYCQKNKTKQKMTKIKATDDVIVILPKNSAKIRMGQK